MSKKLYKYLAGILVAALRFTRRVLDTPLPSAGPARLFRHPGLGRVVDELEDHLFLQADAQDNREALKPLRRGSGPGSG